MLYRGVRMVQRRWKRGFSSVTKSGSDFPNAMSRVELRNWLERMDVEAHAVSAVQREENIANFATLRIFNAETARVADASGGNSAAMAARFGFWEDMVRWAVVRSSGGDLSSSSVVSQFPTVGQHPLAESLAKSMREGGYASRYLNRVIEARVEEGAQNGACTTVEDIEDYCDRTAGSLLCAHLECEGVSVETDEMEELVLRSARAIGIATLIRGIPQQLAQQRVTLPVELLEQNMLSSEQLFSLIHHLSNPSTSTSTKHQDHLTKLCHIVNELAIVGMSHIQNLRQLQSSINLPSNAKRPLLLLLPALNYYRNLDKADFNVFHPNLRKPSRGFSFSIQLAKHTFRNTFIE